MNRIKCFLQICPLGLVHARFSRMINDKSYLILNCIESNFKLNLSWLSMLDRKIYAFHSIAIAFELSMLPFSNR